MQLNFSLGLLYCNQVSSFFLFSLFAMLSAERKTTRYACNSTSAWFVKQKKCSVILHSKMLIQRLQTFQFGKKLAVILAMKMLNQSWESRTCLSRCDITRLQPPWPRCDYGIYAIKLCGLNFLFLYSARRGFFLVKLCGFFLSFHLRLMFDYYIIVHVYESR